MVLFFEKNCNFTYKIHEKSIFSMKFVTKSLFFSSWEKIRAGACQQKKQFFKDIFKLDFIILNIFSIFGKMSFFFQKFLWSKKSIFLKKISTNLDSHKKCIFYMLVFTKSLYFYTLCVCVIKLANFCHFLNNKIARF